MHRNLDITPLRSLVAVADHEGFGRAAEALHLTQPAVSQHVKRLERVVGRPLVSRRGRVMEFTADGVALLAEARTILAAHDDALERLRAAPRTIVLGSTEHAAEELLPAVQRALAAHDVVVRFRLDASARLAHDVERGTVDVALLLGAGPTDDEGQVAGEIPLRWVAASGWTPPAGRAVPLVALDAPCLIRERAMDALAVAGRRVDVAVSAAHLSGVLVAVRSGLGVAALATSGHLPDGLVPCEGLPPLQPVPVRVQAAEGAHRLGALTLRAVRHHLAQPTGTASGPAAAAV